MIWYTGIIDLHKKSKIASLNYMCGLEVLGQILFDTDTTFKSIRTSYNTSKSECFQLRNWDWSWHLDENMFQ